ncbi:MAG: Helix-turn-helix of insertion element transposase [Phycisphaerales bacterium]|nr:Helix-turn-helix of insertion element transposase [Phycisphaerales bacterium]
MESTSSNGGSVEPIPTPSNPAAGEPLAEATTDAAQSDSAPLVVDAQPVSPALIPQCDGLSPQQRVAITTLASGESFVAAARAAGVSGPTLYRWRKHDPAFVAALNAWRNQAQDAVRDRLLAMADQAAMTIFGAMRKGDAKMAMTLLKGLGSLSPATRGPESADAARRELDRDEWDEYIKVQEQRVALRAANDRLRFNSTGEKMFAQDRRERGERENAAKQ